MRVASAAPPAPHNDSARRRRAGAAGAAGVQAQGPGAARITARHRYLPGQARNKPSSQLSASLGHQFKWLDVATPTKLEEHKIWIFMQYETTPCI